MLGSWEIDLFLSNVKDLLFVPLGSVFLGFGSKIP